MYVHIYNREKSRLQVRFPLGQICITIAYKRFLLYTFSISRPLPTQETTPVLRPVARSAKFECQPVGHSPRRSYCLRRFVIVAIHFSYWSSSSNNTKAIYTIQYLTCVCTVEAKLISRNKFRQTSSRRVFFTFKCRSSNASVFHHLGRYSIEKILVQKTA